MASVTRIQGSQGRGGGLPSLTVTAGRGSKMCSSLPTSDGGHCDVGGGENGRLVAVREVGRCGMVDSGQGRTGSGERVVVDGAAGAAQ